uniref:Cilia- and flagella-associated protein 69 ARM repeats domain-containing protein n=1 Tax=Xiphophorus maculatus TaxID=8083 RepID=A0A3B5RBM9_XIPMA
MHRFCAKFLKSAGRKLRNVNVYQFLLQQRLCFLLRIPFLKEKVSDDLIYAQDAINFLSCLGTYAAVSTDLHVFLVFTHFLVIDARLFISFSDRFADLNCRSMLDAGAAQIVCLHMNGGDPPGRVLSSSSEILWTLLDSSGRDDAVAQLCSLDCVVSLKEAFSSVLALTSQGFDLQLRNYLLVFTSLIAENPNCPLVFCLTKSLNVIFEKNVFLFQVEISSAQKLTHSKEDLKMKKLLLNLLILLSRNVGAVQLFREELVMVSLLRFVNPPEKQPPSPQRAILSQQEELQLQALETLVSIAPVMLQDYMSCQGNTQLLLLLDWCSKYFFSHGLGTETVPYKSGPGNGNRWKQQMQRCIRVLRAVTSLGEQSVNQDLSDQGAIHQLLGNTRFSRTKMAAVNEMMSNIQLILSALCETDLHRKELFGSEGVEMVVHFLKKGAKNFYSGLGYNKLLISTIDCVWSCIIGCSITENEFLWKDGAGLLMDLLHSSPRCVHSIILSILLDLCNNPNTRPLVLGWRDADGLTAPGVLLQLWREEEEELGVLRDKNGGIVDPEKPLLTRFQDEICNLTFPANAPSAAVLETMENLRGKIYLLLSNLGFQDLPGLSVGDQVTLGIVRRYLDFKVCEVWNEIRRELSLDGVKPITSDEKALHSISKTLTEAAQSVMVEQSRVLEEQKQQEIQEEMRVYTEQELAAKSWEKLLKLLSVSTIINRFLPQRKKHLKSKLRPKEAVDDRRQKVSHQHSVFLWFLSN